MPNERSAPLRIYAALISVVFATGLVSLDRVGRAARPSVLSRLRAAAPGSAAAGAPAAASSLAARATADIPRPAAGPRTTRVRVSTNERGTARVRRPSGTSSSGFAAMYPAQWAAARSDSDPASNHWALLIGINDYAPPTRDNIGSYQDAVALRTHLLSLGWRSDHILLVGNRDATVPRIVQGIRWLASKTDAESVAVFHYSGHEKPARRDVDGDGEARDVAIWAADNRLLVDGDLGRELGRVRAARMWINLAVCRAGGFDDPGMAGPGRLITYSSPERELSYEDPSVRHSVFGYYSIAEGMRQRLADSDGDGLVTVEEAFAYARPNVIDRTGGRQHPVMVDEAGGELSLKPPAAPPEEAPSQPQEDQDPCTLPVRCRAAAWR